MRKRLSFLDKKSLDTRPELMAAFEAVQAKEAAFEQLKKQKNAAKKDLKTAVKSLKKLVKSKPDKKADKPSDASVEASKAANPTTKWKAGKKSNSTLQA